MVCVKGVVVEKDGVRKMNVLAADAVELGRRVLELSFAITSHVCIIVTVTEGFVILTVINSLIYSKCVV